MMLHLLIPEIILAVSASTLLGFGFSKKKSRSDLVRYLALIVLLAYVASGFIMDFPTGEVFNGAVVVDDLGYYTKFIVVLASAAAILFAKSYLKPENLDTYEYTVLMLYAVLGMSVMISSNNLLAVYIGIELQSLALYVLAAYNRDSLRASEAGLKYFVLGALSSGLLLYGISLIYGFTGSLDFNDIAQAVELNGMSSGVIAGMVFILCGLGFKISAAPFHMWTPDVYEGAPTPVTGFFAGAPKLAAMIIITRLITGPFASIGDQWKQVIIVFAVLSMFVGAIGALRQDNIKRLMAYSSIANMGYALVPLVAGGEAGVRGMLIFMSIYLITMVGVFAVILQMRIRDGMVENIKDLAGLSKTNMPLAVLMSIFMFSLMGIPPLVGFFGKLYAFYPAIEAGYVWLVVLALVASVISAFYYLRIVKFMWFDEAEREFVGGSRTLSGLTTASGALLIVLILPVVAISASSWLDQAAASIF